MKKWMMLRNNIYSPLTADEIIYKYWVDHTVWVAGPQKTLLDLIL